MREPSIPNGPARQDEAAPYCTDPIEAARLIAADIDALMVRADKAGHRLLVYLLDMAHDEATKQATKIGFRK